MNDKIKNSLGAAAVIVLFAFAYAAVSYVKTYSQSVQPSSFRSFTVSGQGKAVAVPDVAQFTFSVITQDGADIVELQRKNTEKVNAIIAFIKSKGIDAKDIKTQNYNILPRYQSYRCPPIMEGVSPLPRPCPPPAIVGYAVNQTVQIKIRDFNKTGEIFSGIAEYGANSVSQLSFTIDDSEKPQNQARAEAIIKAREKAQAIADSADFKLGRLLNISEGGYYPQPSYFAESAGKGGGFEGPSGPSPTIEPGSQEITVNVALQYEIK